MFTESNEMELKREYTKSYLKTVSAFSNERNGKIIFGVTDDGEIIGIEDDIKIRHQIENAIHDSFNSTPDFELETKMIDGKKIVILSVFRGRAIPYLFKGKPYMRTDTSTFIADDFRVSRWFQEVLNIKFEEMLVDDEEFTYNYLAYELKENMGLTKFSEDTLITLGLRKSGKYTNAGRFFADVNSFHFGVDIVKFGANHSQFIKRLRMTNQSILKQFNEAMDFFDVYYHDYEEIVGKTRVNRVRIPKKSFREALANAIIHRDYQMNANIQIEFWDTHIRVMSPGGLTSEITVEQYLNGGVSIPRNAIVANIFYRLNIIEILGTGIARIKQEYLPFSQSPKFKVLSNIIEIELPVISYDKAGVSDRRMAEVLTLLEKGSASRAENQEKLNLSASITKNILASLALQNKIERFGKGRATKYRLL